ncbi:MAG: Fe-S cluster assembly protein SufD [Xanthobacteraceae bacterium]
MNAEIHPIRTAAESALAASFAAAKPTLPGTPEVRGLREQAFARFEAAGLPHRRVEEWKYTDLRAFMREALPLAPLPDGAATNRAKSASDKLTSIDGRRLVLVDGTFVKELSDLADLEPGLTISSTRELLSTGDALVARHLGRVVATNDIAVALNTAFMADGVIIHVAAAATLGRPVHLVFINSGILPAAVFARSLMVIEPGARAMLIESHEGAATNQVNTVLELVVGDRAHVDHVKMTGTGAGALHLSTLLACIGRQARFAEFLFTTGGEVVRNQLFVTLAGQGTIVHIGGANLLRARQHVDTTVFADHAVADCNSREIFKSVLDGESRGIFQGKILVRPGAQKTDARMAAHALLLSDQAEADNKPELEIFADDVQCGHGATCGALDQDLLFYLKARGIPAKEAEALLIQAFVGEAVESIEHAGLRDTLMDQVAHWLEQRG